MDKDVVYILNGILLSHKKNEIMLFAATSMDLGPFFQPGILFQRRTWFASSRPQVFVQTGGTVVKNLPANARDVGDTGSVQSLSQEYPLE